MTDYHRGRRRSHRDYDYDDGYYDDQEPRPRRHRSLGHQALVKAEDAMAGLGLNDKHQSYPGSRHHSRGYDHDNDYDRDHHHRHGRSTHSHHGSGSHGHHRDRSRRSHHDDHYTASRSRAYSLSPTRRSRNRSTHGGRSYADVNARSRSRSRADKGFKAAVDAAAIEAFRLRNEPGSWTGAKGARVATAAISAGAIRAVAEQRKEEHGHSRIGPLGSALAGVAVNRLVNGPRSDLR